MYQDAQLLLSDAQAVTADAGSTNVIELANLTSQYLDGEPMAVVITVDVAADATTGDETYAFVIQTDDNSSFSSTTAVLSQTVLAAALTVGAQIVMLIPVGVSLERYLRLYFDVGGTTPTVTVTASVMPLSMIDKRKFYPKGYTIS